MPRTSTLLCGCHATWDDERRVTEVTTCPWCMALRSCEIRLCGMDLGSLDKNDIFVLGKEAAPEGVADLDQIRIPWQVQ